MAIHDRLRHARKASGMTQSQVAEGVELTTQAISHYETGRTEPSLSTLQKICRFIGVPVETIIKDPKAAA
jgi:transcriptional regulator with XRE-family HTH domain